MIKALFFDLDGTLLTSSRKLSEKQMINEMHSFRYGLTDKEYILWGIENDLLVSFTNLKCRNVVKIVVFSPCSLLKDLYNCLVKACARFITLSNDEEGIHFALKNIRNLI